MPKPRKAKPIKIKGATLPSRWRNVALHLTGVIVMITGLGVGYHQMRQYVERDLTFPALPPKVVLKNRPLWMSDALAIQLINSIKPVGTHSAFDHQLLTATVALLDHNPWIKQVREVRRVYGAAPADTLEVDCDYRVPVALVHWKDFFWLVDGDGVKLPEQYTLEQLPAITASPDGHLRIRIIDGVVQPPVESGQKWLGEDLAAGLDLAKLLFEQPYADEITRVDVTNFAGRVAPKDAQLALVTKYGTRVQWGRPINAKDFFVEIPTARKLQILAEVYHEFHRIDGGRPWIDIRFDRITYPSDDAHADGSR